MAYTVSDVLSLDTFQKATLLSGIEGLHKPIHWVNILEILDDFNSIQPHELLITTAFGLNHDQELQQKLIPMLVKKQLSCLAIQTGYYIKKVPPKIIADAQELQLPLVELPQDSFFSHITTDILTRIVNQQFDLLNFRDTIRRELLQVLLENGGFNDLLQVISNHLQYPVRILDHLFTPICSHPEATQPDSQTQKLVYLRANGYFKQSESEQNIIYLDEPATSIPKQHLLPVISANNQTLGYISVLGITERLDDKQLTILNQSAIICALLFLQEITIKETENRLHGDFLDDLLAGNFSSLEQIRKRAKFLGYDLNKTGMIFVGSIGDLDNYIKEDNEISIVKLKNRLLHLVETSVKSFTRHQFIIRLRSNIIIILVLSPDAKNIQWQKQLADNMRKCIRFSYPKLSFSIGIGRFYQTIHNLPKSFSEAEQALEYARKLKKNNSIIVFEELGFYRLLLQKSESEMYTFYEETIGTLVDYDEKKGSNLKYTLEVYLQCGQNTQSTADKLFIHRHTLRYRLKRIEEIAGVNLQQSDHVFNLQIGLKLHKLLSPD